jgi:hypothetical protein
LVLLGVGRVVVLPPVGLSCAVWVWVGEYGWRLHAFSERAVAGCAFGAVRVCDAQHGGGGG